MQKLCNLLSGLTTEINDLIKKLESSNEELIKVISFPEELNEILNCLIEEYKKYLRNIE